MELLRGNSVSNEMVATGLAARNMSQTELDIVTSCSICYSNLRAAAMKLEDVEIRAKVNAALEKEYRGAKIRHALDVILEVLEKDDQGIVVPLKELKVAAYYGCLLSRPPGVYSPEYPVVLEKLIRILRRTLLTSGGRPSAVAGRYSCPRRRLPMRRPIEY